MKRTYDAILLLGLRLNPDGSAQEEMLLRSKKAAELWKAGVAPVIVACGGPTGGSGRTEAEVLKEELVSLAVAESAVYCACISVGNPGKGNVSTRLAAFRSPSLSNFILSPFAVILQPFSRSLCKRAAIFSSVTPSVSIFPPFIAAAIRNVPASILSFIGV